MKCPHCGKKINVGSLIGSVKSKAKSKAARRNGKLGGRPVSKKRKRDVNVAAHSVVAEAEKLTRRAAPLAQ